MQEERKETEESDWCKGYERFQKEQQEQQERESRQAYQNRQKRANEDWPITGDSEDAYSILQVSRTANETQVTEAYHKLAMEWHPDKFSKYNDPKVNVLANKNFVKIQTAYEEIKQINNW